MNISQPGIEPVIMCIYKVIFFSHYSIASPTHLFSPPKLSPEKVKEFLQVSKDILKKIKQNIGRKSEKSIKSP